MTSFDRVYGALSYEPVDRVPFVPKLWVDYSAKQLGISLIDVITDPDTALKCVPEAAAAAGLDGARLFHFPERMVSVKEGRVYETDSCGNIIGTVDIQGGLATSVHDPESLCLSDPFIIAHINCWVGNSPLVRSMEDVLRIAVPSKQELHDFGWAKRQRRVMDEYRQSLALIGDCHSATMAFLVSLRGMEQAILDLYDNPKLVHAVMEKGAEIAIEKGKFHCDMGIRILRLNDSVGNMTVISPQMWRDFVFPRIQLVCRELHRYEPEVKIYCHICGNVEPVMEDLILTGLDCIGPLDPLGGMSVRRAREIVGDNISLMGGINTLSFINALPEEILAEARSCINGAGKSGFILGSGCVMPRDSNPENVAAVQNYVELAEECRL